MTIHIKDPWTMPELQDCDKIIEGIIERLGRHSLGKKKIFPLAISDDPLGAIVEAEEGEEFYAVVYYTQMRDGKVVEKPRVVMLEDRASVQKLIDDDNAAFKKPA